MAGLQDMQRCRLTRNNIPGALWSCDVSEHHRAARLQQHASTVRQDTAQHTLPQMSLMYATYWHAAHGLCSLQDAKTVSCMPVCGVHEGHLWQSVMCCILSHNGRISACGLQEAKIVSCMQDKVRTRGYRQLVHIWGPRCLTSSSQAQPGV